MSADITPADLPECENLDTVMLTCPYNQGIKGASCVSGCREEPRCQTDEPLHGWKPRDRHGRFVAVTHEQLKSAAQQRWNDHQARRQNHLVAAPDREVSP
ncbi:MULTISPECIES: hypothetical protein [Nocardia]|uniref:hypothetical protein n=1 Tax=Nocardia TaxID=1817 RepID=UPI0024579E3B|nr:MULTISPECIES: hypothetical protein [Nocardia]